MVYCGKRDCGKRDCGKRDRVNTTYCPSVPERGRRHGAVEGGGAFGEDRRLREARAGPLLFLFAEPWEEALNALR